jgi:16S rRNA (cytidine1402-2'-O)-methyltransferase
VSLISDAGTPSVSDPGAILINECVVNDINVYPIPGASSVSTAVSISGFDEKYFFYGFFPEKNVKLREDFEKLSKLNSCIVFFISPRKFNKSIKDIKHHFSGRKILICREMTKFYEEYIRSDINKLEPFKSDPKGELTIVISEKPKEKNSSIILKESDKKNIQKMIKKLSIKDITDLISQNSNVQKKEIYNYCLKLKNEK